MSYRGASVECKPGSEVGVGRLGEVHCLVPGLWVTRGWRCRVNGVVLHTVVRHRGKVGRIDIGHRRLLNITYLNRVVDGLLATAAGPGGDDRAQSLTGSMGLPILANTPDENQAGKGCHAAEDVINEDGMAAAAGIAGIPCGR